MDIANSNSRELWQGVSKITGYKPKVKSAPTNDAKLPDELNIFYTRFDRPVPNRPASSEPDEPPFQLTVDDTRRGLSKLNVKKAPGPDNFSPGLLRRCADELSVSCAIFSFGLFALVICRMFSKNLIIPIPKRTPVTCHNEYI